MGCASSDMMKFVMSTMLLMGLSPMAVSRALQPVRRGPHRDVLEHQRAVSRAQVEVFDLDFDGRRAGGQQIELHRDRAGACPTMAATSRAMP